MNLEIPTTITLLPLLFIFNALVFNTSLSYILLNNKKLNKSSSMRYLAIIATFDTLSLFTWNLNQFLKPNFNFEIEHLNAFTCKFFIYLQFTTLQISSLLRCLVCIDRYYYIVKLKNKKQTFGIILFGTIKSVNYWSLCVIGFIFVLNLHLLINAGSYKTTTNSHRFEFDCYQTNHYNIRPTWNRVNLVLNCSLPFILMTIFDALLIHKAYIVKQNVISNQVLWLNAFRSTPRSFSQNHKTKRLTFSLLFISVFYLLMSLPPSIFYSFFIHTLKTKIGAYYSFFFNMMTFSQHSVLFFQCYLTNKKFRDIVRSYFHNNNDNKKPLFTVTMQHKHNYV